MSFTVLQPNPGFLHFTMRIAYHMNDSFELLRSEEGPPSVDTRPRLFDRYQTLGTCEA